MFEINQVSETEWEILNDSGSRIGATHPTYELAVAFVGGMLAFADQAAAMDGPAVADGLLPEGWVGDPAICFAQDTGDIRDFTGCVWTSRAPAVSTMPLMLQTATEMGHMGAQLAGFITEVSNLGAGTNPSAQGRFYDTETGRAARDLLLDGRSFGVSVDPGAHDEDWVCVEEDEDGMCVAERVEFRAYEIIGLTLTPFPAFPEAAIRLDTPAVTASVTYTIPAPLTLRSTSHTLSASVSEPAWSQDAGVTATALRPPGGWFQTAEPELGAPFDLGDLGDEWLVDQGQGRLAMPLEITADGRVAGHLAVWGDCHVGYPGTCVTPPVSHASYAHFHVGEVVTAEGDRTPVGALSASCDHAATALRAPEARDHYAHNGIAWANVRATNGVYGPWVCGSLRPGVTDEQVAVLRAGAMSGDWRRIGGNLELIAALAVTTPGFQIAREAIVASGLRITAPPRAAASIVEGEQVSLVASGLVRRCPDCARRASAGVGVRNASVGVDLDQMVDIRATLALLERRTRHLVGPAAEHAATMIRH